MNEAETEQSLLNLLHPFRWRTFEQRMLAGIFILTGLNVIVGLIVLVTT